MPCAQGKKRRKAVERRASKGRKLRYQVCDLWYSRIRGVWTLACSLCVISWCSRTVMSPSGAHRPCLRRAAVLFISCI